MVITLLDLIWGDRFYTILGLFLKARYRMGIFLGSQKFRYTYLGIPDIPDIF